MDSAFALSEGEPENDIEGLAMSVAFGEIQGGSFDWRRMKWEEKSG